MPDWQHMRQQRVVIRRNEWLVMAPLCMPLAMSRGMLWLQSTLQTASVMAIRNISCEDITYFLMPVKIRLGAYMKGNLKILHVAITLFSAIVLAANAGFCLAAPQDVDIKPGSEDGPKNTIQEHASATVIRLPSALEALSNDSERLYSLASANDWPNIPSIANSIRLDYNQLPVNLADFRVQSAALSSVIMDLNQQVLGHHRYAVMRSANRVMLIAARLAAPFRPHFTFDIELLGYYGREIEIGTMSDDTDGVRSAASQLPQVSMALRATIAQRRNGGATKGLDDIATLFARARTLDDYRQLALSIEEEVTDLRRVFR